MPAKADEIVAPARPPGAEVAHRGARLGPAASAPITVGLVNNMPDAALQATERQFLRLLAGAGRGANLRVRLFHLPELGRGAEASRHLAARSAPVDELFHAGVDALIVTGSEPRRPRLQDEPCWAALAGLVDWAAANTVSTLWSCLAAHAAVLRLDGIERRPLPQKLSGVYAFDRPDGHALLRGLPRSVPVPHSRHNGLREDDLAGHGYEILTRSEEAGVDTFVRRCPSLFVFLQGHPEYDADSLYREYRRDMARYLAAERDRPPALPQGYFGRGAIPAFEAFAEAARADRTPERLRHFPGQASVPRARWQRPAARLFANWLDLVGRAKRRDAAAPA